MNLSNGGGDTAPEEPMPDANPELKLDAALVNDPPPPSESAADAGDVNASDSDFPPLPNGLLRPAGICGGRRPPIAEPADGGGASSASGAPSGVPLSSAGGTSRMTVACSI